MYETITKYIVVLLLVLGIGYLGYNKIYAIGYDSAKIEYEKKIDKYEKSLNTRIEKIEKHSEDLIEKYNEGKVQAAKDYKNILAAAKTKPLVIYQNGICEISPDFAEAYRRALERANKK